MRRETSAVLCGDACTSCLPAGSAPALCGRQERRNMNGNPAKQCCCLGIEDQLQRYRVSDGNITAASGLPNCCCSCSEQRGHAYFKGKSETAQAALSISLYTDSLGGDYMQCRVCSCCSMQGRPDEQKKIETARTGAWFASCDNVCPLAYGRRCCIWSCCSIPKVPEERKNAATAPTAQCVSPNNHSPRDCSTRCCIWLCCSMPKKPDTLQMSNWMHPLPFGKMLSRQINEQSPFKTAKRSDCHNRTKEVYIVGNVTSRSRSDEFPFGFGAKRCEQNITSKTFHSSDGGKFTQQIPVVSQENFSVSNGVYKHLPCLGYGKAQYVERSMEERLKHCTLSKARTLLDQREKSSDLKDERAGFPNCKDSKSNNEESGLCEHLMDGLFDRAPPLSQCVSEGHKSTGVKYKDNSFTEQQEGQAKGVEPPSGGNGANVETAFENSDGYLGDSLGICDIGRCIVEDYTNSVDVQAPLLQEYVKPANPESGGPALPNRTDCSG